MSRATWLCPRCQQPVAIADRCDACGWRARLLTASEHALIEGGQMTARQAIHNACLRNGIPSVAAALERRD